MGVLIATAAGVMVQRHRIAILTARNVYNFDNVSNNLFLSGNTLRGQFHSLVSPPSFSNLALPPRSVANSKVRSRPAK